MQRRAWRAPLERRALRGVGLRLGLGFTIALGVLASASVPGCGSCVPHQINQNAVTHLNFAAKYYEKGKLTEARARANLAIEYAPKYAEAWNLLGLIEYADGRSTKAKEHYKRALAYKQDFAEAYNNMGALYMDEKDYAMACDLFKQALEVDPGYLEARLNYAGCLYYSDDLKESKVQYRRCVELDPKMCDCRLGLGVIALDREKWDVSQSHFEKLNQVCPDNPHGFYNLGWVLMQKGRCGEAVDALISALALKDDYLEARRNLTEAYQCLALQEGGIEEYEAQIKANPGDPALHYNLGTVYEDKKLFERALNEYLNTIKLASEHVRAHYRAARLFDRMMRTEKTIEYCKRFVDLVSDGALRDERQWCVSRVKELQYQE